MLYNEEIQIEIESLNSYEFYIDVNSNDVTSDIVGRRIIGETGSANITYFERSYVGGVRQWRFALNNLIGNFSVTSQNLFNLSSFVN